LLSNHFVQITFNVWIYAPIQKQILIRWNRCVSAFPNICFFAGLRSFISNSDDNTVEFIQIQDYLAVSNSIRAIFIERSILHLRHLIHSTSSGLIYLVNLLLKNKAELSQSICNRKRQKYVISTRNTFTSRWYIVSRTTRSMEAHVPFYSAIYPLVPPGSILPKRVTVIPLIIRRSSVESPRGQIPRETTRSIFPSCD